MRKLAIPLLALSAALTTTTSAPAQIRGGGIIPPIAETRPDDPTTVTAVGQRLDQLRRDIEARIGRPYYDPDSVRIPFEALADQRDKALLTQAAREAREEAIQKKIDDLTRQARDQLANDPTLAQLQKVADAAQADAERSQTLIAKGLVPTSELEAKTAAAAEAQVRILERRDAIMASAGGGALAALNKELITVSLDVSEQTALLNYLDARLRLFRDADALSREYQRLSNLLWRFQSTPK